MKNETKLFITIIFVSLSIPCLFFSYGLMKLQFNEHIKYGNIESATIINTEIEPYTGASAEFGADYIYKIKIINNKKLESIIFQSSVENSDFISGSKIGDTIQVKIIAENQAKILNWKNFELNKSKDYWRTIGNWIIICVLLSIVFLLYYKVYKIVLK